jgi:hypothetical protein
MTQHEEINGSQFEVASFFNIFFFFDGEGKE